MFPSLNLSQQRPLLQKQVFPFHFYGVILPTQKAKLQYHIGLLHVRECLSSPLIGK